jgi:hypothetical protein
MTDKPGFLRMFRRDRHPGDFVFSVVFLLISIALISQLGEQVEWVKRTKFFAQPAFWPTVSLIGMLFFAVLYFLGSLASPRTPGRGTELTMWARSLEYAAWFLIYVWIVPKIGYLGATILFTLILTYRVGYRTQGMFVGAAAMAMGIVVIFKAFLQVKIPAGQIYEYLPDGIRNFMLLYL